MQKNGGVMKRFINDIKKYYKYSIYAAKAELKSEVAGSYLGWIWWFLEPLCFMFVYAFMVMTIFKSSEEYMLAFVFIGNTIWTFFNKNLTTAVKLISSNKQIVTKVYIPKFILVLIKMMVNSFKMFVSLGIVAGLMAIYQIPLSITMLEMIPILILISIFTFGVCIILSHFGVFIEDLSNIISILLKLVFYFSGIFYSVSKRIPAPYGQLMAKLNPAAFFIEESRKVLLYGTHMNFEIYTIWFTIAIIVCVIGIRLIYKNENNYVKVMS